MKSKMKVGSNYKSQFRAIRNNKKNSKDAREAQLIWTFFVGVAVLIAALYQVSSPKHFFTSQTTNLPEAVKTGIPLKSIASNINQVAVEPDYVEEERTPAAASAAR